MFHQGALGDFLLALSALEGWCATRPASRVDFWSKREHVSLLSGKEYLGDFHSIEGPLVPSFLNDSLWETVPLPDFLVRADHVFIFGQEGTRVLARRLSARIDGRVDWVRSFPGPDHAGTHVLDFIRDQLAGLGQSYPKVSALARICPAASDIAAAERLLEDHGMGANSRPVLLHPGSGGKKKVWPLKNWRDLPHWVRNGLSLPVILSVGPADGCLDDFLREVLPDRRHQLDRGPADECLEDFLRGQAGTGIPVVSGLSLVRLAAVLSRCGLYIGSDSGVSHLAAAVGTPTVVIFGPTDPDVWAPRAETVRVVRRSWSEEEIFDWDPSAPPGEPDPEIIAAVRDLL
ncbi:MAG: glycosyltransferase family 9 protein [Syntrophobacteraceae bacterium]